MDNAPRSTSLLKAHDSKEERKKRKKKKRQKKENWRGYVYRILFSSFFLFNIIIIQMLKMYE